MEETELTMSITKGLPETRYSKVRLDSGGDIISFIEKSETQSDLGYIDAGVNFISHKIKDQLPKEKIFSFQKDFLETNLRRLNIRGFCIVEDFIDIGIPDDYKRAQEFKFS